MAKKHRSSSEGTHSPLASRRELDRFLDGLAKVRERVKDRDEQQEAMRRYVQENTNREERERLAGRAFADAFKSPSQKLGTAKPSSSTRARRSEKRRSPRKKSRR
jgi:hypothetical protein